MQVAERACCRGQDSKNDDNVVDEREHCVDDTSCANSAFARGAECASIERPATHGRSKRRRRQLLI
jgi:hypothetical protein